jgi:hypothetical protein
LLKQKKAEKGGQDEGQKAVTFVALADPHASSPFFL